MPKALANEGSIFENQSPGMGLERTKKSSERRGQPSLAREAQTKLASLILKIIFDST